jgi:ribosomal-protein-alanine N-acetyltransferase
MLAFPVRILPALFFMHINPAVVLETPRLVLRPLRTGDASDLFAIFSDPETMRYGSRGPWTSMDDAYAFLQRDAEGSAAGRHLCLGMQLKAAQQVIGTCTLFAIDSQNQRAELGYGMLPAVWGQGYMHEALRCFISYLFGEAELRRMEADIDPDNLASARTLVRLRFQQEGFLRERWLVHGKIADTCLYGLLQREWQGGTGQRR